MYHSSGYKNCLETIVLLSIKEFDCLPLDSDALKAHYKDFLVGLQPNIPTGSSLGMEFVSDLKTSQELANCFNINLEKEGIDQLINHNGLVEDPITKLREQLETLCKLDNHLYSVFTLAVNMIFCGNSAHAVGGTTSAAIGVVWANPNSEWRLCDYLEYFVHELTHTLMFLDELRFLHYKNQAIMYNKENFSLSAILQAERPMDRVLHSIMVATEILLLRFKNLVDHSVHQVHPSTDQLIESTQTSIEKLLSHPNRDNILTPRSLELIELCQYNLSQHVSLASFS